MSGDGVDDVKIPSVFMKKKDGLYLLGLMKSTEVIVKLSPGPEDDGEGEGAWQGEEEGEGEGHSEDEVVGGDRSVEDVSKELQGLLEGLDTSVLSDQLRGSVAEQLQKLKDLNSGLTSADSATLSSEARKEEDTAGLAWELKRSVSHQLKVLSDAGLDVNSEELKSLVAGRLQEVINAGSCSADSALSSLGVLKAAKGKYEGEDRAPTRVLVENSKEDPS